MNGQANGQNAFTGKSRRASAAAGEKDPHRYDDIIDLPHHVSRTHPQMPLADRAAQFAPFAALTGHADAIRETERAVTERVEHENDGETDPENWFVEEMERMGGYEYD